MIRRIIAAIATATALTLLMAPAQAGPMKCSGEQKTCLTFCQKNVNPALQTQCVAGCHARQNYCRQTGCWDNGTSRYCGLLRQ